MPAEQDMKRSYAAAGHPTWSRDSIRPCFWSWSEELEIKRMDSILPMKRWPTASPKPWSMRSSYAAAATRIRFSRERRRNIPGLKIETWGTAIA